MPNFTQPIVITLPLFMGLVGQIDHSLVAGETAAVIAGEPQLIWLSLLLDPLPERAPAKVLLAHDGKAVRRVMVDDLGIASTVISESYVRANRVTADLVVGHSGIRINRQMVPPLSTRKPLRLELTTKVGPLWQPPHPRATTYQVPMSHAWADGRLFIRGADALYCYDLRKRLRRK